MTAAEPEQRADASEIAHGALRGAIAAMAMTGMRTFTIETGLIDEPPPEALIRQKARALLRQVPRPRRRAAVELAHWAYGAGGGAVFAALPDGLRRRAWAGPVYGLIVWLGFELAIAPVLRLSQAKQLRAQERAALALDHLLYGLVLSEMRARPQEPTPGAEAISPG
jgi:hypothetical protein